jgi:hypothetical protein
MFYFDVGRNWSNRNHRQNPALRGYHPRLDVQQAAKPWQLRLQAPLPRLRTLRRARARTNERTRARSSSTNFALSHPVLQTAFRRGYGYGSFCSVRASRLCRTSRTAFPRECSVGAFAVFAHINQSFVKQHYIRVLYHPSIQLNSPYKSEIYMFLALPSLARFRVARVAPRASSAPWTGCSTPRRTSIGEPKSTQYPVTRDQFGKLMNIFSGIISFVSGDRLSLCRGTTRERQWEKTRFNGHGKTKHETC